MIRQFRRGILSGRLVIAAPCRPPERRGHLQQSANTQKHLERSFSLTCKARKQPDARFFWPSRPDFLPTKSSKIDDGTRFDGRERRRRAAQSIRRFRPIGGAKVSLPSPEEVTYSHAPMYTSIAKVEVDTAWSHFVSHLNELSNNKAAPLESGLFDALFWLIATENFTSMQRHEEVFGRVEILSMYASSQVDYGLTRLQLHRTVYIWTSLWENYDVRNASFSQTKFTETVLSCLNDLDSRLASRVFTRLLNECKTPDEMAKIVEMIKSWLELGQCKMTRQETWASTSLIKSPNDDVYFKEEDRGAIDSQMWKQLLQKCFEIGISKETVNSGMLALRQAELDPSLDYVSQFLAFLHVNQLYSILPSDVRDGAAAIDYTLQVSPSIIADRSFTEETRRRLMYPIAFVLATRLHYAPALYLYEADEQKNNKDDRSIKEVEVYTAAANACARLALEGPHDNDTSLDSAKWTLVQLQRGLRLFIDCDWYESRSRNTTAKLIIRVLWKCVVLDQTKASIQSDTQWLFLLRQFTTMLLTHDPNLATLQIEEDITTYSRLVRLHIYLKDYPFAKRLFLVRSMQEGHIDSTAQFLIQDDFLWLFEQSLEMEADARFASQLFLYWTCLDVGENQSLPPSLLRTYFWKLRTSTSARVAIKMLHENLDLQDLSGKGDSPRPSHAIRMMRTYFAVKSDSIDLSLNMAEDLLDYWKQKEKKWQISTLVHLYSIAMEGSTKYIHQLDPIVRSRIMGLFSSFQQYFAAVHRNTRRLLVRECKDSIETVYACAIRTLIEEKEIQSVGIMTYDLIRELRNRWEIKPYSSQLWSLRVEACLVGTDVDVDRAKILYAKAMHLLDHNEVKGSEGIISASVTAKLMMALAKKGSYEQALDLISTYKNYAGPLRPKSKAFIEGAHIAILHMQGHVEEALQKLKDLKSQGDEVSVKGEGTKKSNARWLRIVSRATENLEEQIKGQQVDSGREESQYDLPITYDEEEQERERMFRAMAGGQPWRR